MLKIQIQIKNPMRLVVLASRFLLVLSACCHTAFSNSLVTAYVISGVQNGQCTVSSVNGSANNSTALGLPQVAFPDDSGTEAMCAAAYRSVQAMVNAVNTLLGLPAGTQPQGSFTFYVTTPDPSNDLTSADCSATSQQSPEGGAPLCSLLTYATDVGMPGFTDSQGLLHPAIVGNSRDFSNYFISLLTHQPAFLGSFQPSGPYDLLVQGLGEGSTPNSTSGGATSFYYQVTHNAEIPYYADSQAKTPIYGISSGGGSGWGAELKVPGSQPGTLVTLLSFGGGGGGGMTQNISDPSTNLYAGSGGGGGMQFGNGFIYSGQLQNHLGLGAGAGTSFVAAPSAPKRLNPGAVQYSYNDNHGCTTHDSSSPSAQAVMTSYSAMLDYLKSYMNTAYKKSIPMTLIGGGGMGGGMEAMQNNGQEAPNLISTQGGFSFQYVFQAASQSSESFGSASPATSGALGALGALQEGDVLDKLYSVMGGVYQTVSAGALAQCGYQDYVCTCAYNQVHIPAEASVASGIPASQLPSWISNQYCPVAVPASASGASCMNAEGLTAYQQALLEEVSMSAQKSMSINGAGNGPGNGLSASEVMSHTTAYFNAMNQKDAHALEISGGK